MAEVVKKVLKTNVWLHILTSISLLLLVGSWFVPPMGAIDSSVLAGVGEIFAFAALWVAADAIKQGYDAKIQHGDTSVTISDNLKVQEDETDLEANL